jgi:hypothetical protein
MSLPPDERPRQRPVIKAEESGNVILASYPKLRSSNIEDILAFLNESFSVVVNANAIITTGIRDAAYVQGTRFPQ